MSQVESETTRKEKLVQQLTIRGFDDRLERKIRQLANADGISLNKAALALMRRGAGLAVDRTHSNQIGNGLDRFIGRWSGEAQRELLESVSVFDHVDERFWS